MIIADDAAGLYMSHIELNLNEPNKLGDVSWVHPGKFNGVWWNMIKGEWSWATGPKHGATTEHGKKYIDFAAANNIRGVLVEERNSVGAGKSVSVSEDLGGGRKLKKKTISQQIFNKES